MPSLNCRCGERLNYGEIPSRVEWLVISDTEFDAIGDLVNVEQLYEQMRSMLRCPVCGRLWAFWNGFEADPVEYLPQAQVEKAL